ncbi:hypothetical protein BG004_000619 [Podila humilis]|nr:hypothetical protein BG004_000619 [Podila humilis]
MALEKVPHTIDIRYSYAPFPGADLKTIVITLPEGALLLDVIRHFRVENNVPVYLEHSMLSTAQSLIKSTHKTRMEQQVKLVNDSMFSNIHQPAMNLVEENNHATTSSEVTYGAMTEELAPQKALIENYRKNTRQFYTQPEEVYILAL